jgi:aldehyde dehydrogenase (NAD+)
MSQAAANPVRPAPVKWCFNALIDGKLVAGEGEILRIENPATEAIIAEFPQASLGQVDLAVKAARRAFDSGRWSDPTLRASSMRRLADLVEANFDELASAVVQETGTPYSLCRPLQIGAPILFLRDFAERTAIDRVRHLGQDKVAPISDGFVRFHPAGVVAAITAYNYPLHLAVVKMGAALAAGCTVVLMPSALAPLTTLRFGELIREAGFPDGVVNIVAGGPAHGRALSTHSDVDRVSFTGSVDVGREIMHQAAEGIKGVVLELGGKSPAIVLPEADLPSLIHGLHMRYARNAGQGCQSPTRLLVPQAMMADFADLSHAALAKIPVGDPFDPATAVGPLITERHRARVEGYVERAVKAGGAVLAGGGRPDIARGWFMNPTVIGNLGNDSELARNELFGPVAMVLPYRDEEDAVRIANDCELGLAAHVIGPVDRAKALAPRLRAGTVFINGGGNLRPDGSIAGWKKSGIGREWGEAGILEFMVPQYVQWPV